MASVKVKFRPSTVKGCEGTIFYQVIHDRKVRQIVSNYRVLPNEWDAHRSTVTVRCSCKRKAFVLSVRERIRWDLERIYRVERRLEDSGADYSVDDLIEEFNRYADRYSLFNFMEGIIARLKQNGRDRTSETYKSTLNSFRKFRNDEDIMLDEIDSKLMEGYEGWLKSRGATRNTVSFYLRVLRAVYNRAVEYEVVTNRSPFRHVYTGVDKTVKRALPMKVIRRINGLELWGTPALDYARDMFMLSFCLRGMSFVDMAYLRKSDLHNGYVVYRRRKTGQKLIIQWTKEMQLILDKYPENESDYLLPIIRSSGVNERCIYRNVSYNINHSLKKVAEMAGVPIPLTLYVARHSWASAARQQGIPLSVISEGMGHENEATTRIYLASLDSTAIDNANSLILKNLR